MAPELHVIFRLFLLLFLQYDRVRVRIRVTGLRLWLGFAIPFGKKTKK